MMAAVDRLRADCAAIHTAAFAAVNPVRLLAARLSIDAGRLLFDGRPLDPALDLDAIERIAVVGAGKAAAGMAAGVERLLGAERLVHHRVAGVVSVPEGATEGPTAIVARATRPAGANLPTPAVVAATREMLGIVGGLCGDDLAIVVLSGGGSALMALPRDGVSLDEKIAITRRLSESGADIATLNAARRGLSAVKGGGMARACAAGRLLVLVLSDVVGDDLDVIASGPCMPGDASAPDGAWTTPLGCVVRHVVVGTGDTAVAAAAHAARDLGYLVRTRSAISGPETVAPAADVGRRLAAEALALAAESRGDGRPRVLIEGGEATVALPADHGIGGRNQHTVVAALEAVLAAGAWPGGVLVASVGSDGEDGPTAAAGGVADAAVADAVVGGRLDVSAARRRCDAEPLLAAAGGLVITGPTGTNVGDVRMILVRP